MAAAPDLPLSHIDDVHDNKYSSSGEGPVLENNTTHGDLAVDFSNKKSSNSNNDFSQEKSGHSAADLEQAEREEGVKSDSNSLHRIWRRLRPSRLIVCIACWLLITT
jgi:hypothetical protein